MSYVVVTDPKTGEKYLDFKKSGAKSKEDRGLLGLGLQPTDLFPTVAVPAQAFQTAVKGVTAGIQEFQKSGDFGKALTAGQKGAVESLEGNRPIQTVGRIGYNAGRNVAQELSDVVTADIPAMFGAAQPTTSKRPDAPFLGILPPLPKAKSSGPAEDLVTGVAQVAIEWFPAFKAVGLTGGLLKATPGVTRVIKGADATVDTLKGTRVVQGLAAVPGVKPVAGAIASNTLTKGAATGALIDVVGFDQHEGRLYDLVDKLQQQVTGTPLEVPVLSYLRSDPNDVGMAGRLKNALEGAGLGTAVESIFKILRAGKYLNLARQAPAAEKPAAVAKVQEVVADLEDTMVREASQAQEEVVAALPAAPRVAAAAPQEIPTVPIGQVVDEAVPPAPSSTGLTEGLGGMGQGVAQGMRDQMWASYQKGSTRVAGVNDPALAAAKQAGVPATDRAAFDNFLTSYAAADKAVPPAAADVPPQIFHGTTKANAAAIQKEGFKASGLRGDVGNALGDGVFFTSNPQYAKDYGPEVLGGSPAAAGIRLKTLSNLEYEELITSKYGGFDQYDFPKDQQALIKEFGEEFDGVRVTEGFGGPGNNVGDEIVVFDPKKADALIKGQEPSVPSAGTSAPAAPAAGPTPREIQELDQALAMGRADLSPEQRVALRDQVLAERYPTGSPAEPPAPVAMADEVPATAAGDGGDVPPLPPQEPPVVVRAEPPDDAWANKLVSEIQQQNAKLADGSITLDDLLEYIVQ